MKNILPNISLETSADGKVKLITTDAELLDYIDDYLTEECDVEQESLVIDEQSANVFVIIFPKKYKLEEIEAYLVKLDPSEINRIYLLNNK